ncbi:MAG: glycosyltransferase [Oscillochloris sp.]|nr:glycosyltransferase [Oscillochloris sp.]
MSIAIPTYNQIAFVEETLTSALEQDYDPLEVVVADDGSRDGTAELIAALAQRYPGRLRPQLHQTNVGVAANCNRMLRACRGEYIAFQGGDDVLLPGKIRRQVAWMQADPRRVLCGHDAEIFEWPSGHILGRWSDRVPLRSGAGAGLIVRYGSPFTATTMMIRAAAAPNYGFDERVGLASDWKLWIDCLRDGGQFGFIEGVYARYRRHANNLTSVRSGGATQFQRILSETLTTIQLVESEQPMLQADCRYARALQTYACGVSYLLYGDSAVARRYLWDATRQMPLASWKTYAALGLSILPRPVARPLLGWVGQRYGHT